MSDTKIEDVSNTPPAPSFVDRATSPVGIAVIIFLIVLLSVGAYLYATKSSLLSFLPAGSKQQQKRVPTATPTPTPLPRAIPHGKKGFSVGQSDKTVPQMSRGYIDPYDPAKGATQTVTIAVAFTQPVTSVTAILKTDTTVSSPVPLTLATGTNTKGEWQGSWPVNDTYLYTYKLVLQATSGTKTASVEITLR